MRRNRRSHCVGRAGRCGPRPGGPDGRRSRSAARDGAFAVGHTRPTVERAARIATDGSESVPAQGAARSAGHRRA